MNEIPIEIIYKIKFWKIRSGVLNRKDCSYDAELILFGASNFQRQIILIRSDRKSFLTNMKEVGWAPWTTLHPVQKEKCRDHQLTSIN